MQLSTLLVLSLAACAATAYDLNDVEKGAIDCIRYRYDDLGNANSGKLQIGCLDKPKFDDLWIQASTTHGSWNRLPPFRAASKCDPKSSEKPYFLNELLYCASKLLGARCGKETTATDKDKNIQELIDTITPKQKTCAPLYVMTKLEEAALDCIHHSVSTIRGTKGSVDVTCRQDGQFDFLELFFVPATIYTDVQLKEGGSICRASVTNGPQFGKRAVECAKRLLDETCKKVQQHIVSPGGLDKLIAEVRPKEKQICQSDV